MTILSICVMKNEADVIEQALLAALEWSGTIGVLDNGSDDGGWEVVQELAREHPAIVPIGRDMSVFHDDLRAQVYDSLKHLARPGDWWCRLDADEFYPEDPRTALSLVPRTDFSVWSVSLSYYFTDVDAARYAENRAEFLATPVQERLRHYLNHWSEPRFWRHERGMRWRVGDGGYPARLWARPASSSRVVVRHYPYRSPEQIQARLDARRAAADRGAVFSHECVVDWADAVASIRTRGRFEGTPGTQVPDSWTARVVPSEALDRDDHDGRFVVNQSLMPAPPAPRTARDRTMRMALGSARRLASAAGHFSGDR